MQRTSQRPSEWVRKFVSEKIKTGLWKSGDFLPSEIVLAQQLGVHRLTVNGVLKELVREGQLARRRGVGTLVRNHTPQPNGTRHAMIGLVLHHRVDLHTNPFYAEICETIRKRLLASSYFLLPLGSADEVLASRSEETNRVRNGLSGYIFFGPVPSAVADTIRTPEQPTVFVGFSEGSPDTINVSSDDETDSAVLTGKLLNLGHRQIVHINAAGPFRMHSRLNGFLAGMEEAGLPVPYRYILEARGLEYEDGWNAMRTFCETRLPFTAVYGGNDMLACGALDYLQNVGKRVPKDVSVVGFDGISLSGQRLRLTTMAVDRARMSSEAAEALLSVLQGRPLLSPQVRLRSKFLPGETLGTAPRATKD